MTQPQQRERLTYAEALAVAAAAQPRSVVEPSIRTLSLSVARVRDTAATAALAALLPMWRGTDPYDGVAVQAFAESAVAQMDTAQTAVTRATAAAQVAQLRAQGVLVPHERPPSPIDVRGPSVTIRPGAAEVRDKPVMVAYRDGNRKVVDSSTFDVFNRPARVYRFERTRSDVATATKAAETRLADLVDENVMLAQRLAEAATLARAHDLDGRIIGYRRILHPELSAGGSCGLCVAASDRVYKISELKPIHAPRCRCTVAAITKAFDPGNINTIDLSDLYASSGGATAAALKRTRYAVTEHGELAAVLTPVRRASQPVAA